MGLGVRWWTWQDGGVETMSGRSSWVKGRLRRNSPARLIFHDKVAMAMVHGGLALVADKFA